MPRIRQYAVQYSEEDFRKEVFKKMAERYEDISIRALARESGISPSTLNHRIRHDISNLDVSELRQIVPILKPDPAVILKLLGYTGDDIRKFKNS